MEPVARRTRRRTQEALMGQRPRLKKPKTSNPNEVIVLSSSPSASPGRSASSESASTEPESSSPVLSGVRKEVQHKEDEEVSGREMDDEDDVVGVTGNRGSWASAEIRAESISSDSEERDASGFDDSDSDDDGVEDEGVTNEDEDDNENPNQEEDDDDEEEETDAKNPDKEGDDDDDDSDDDEDEDGDDDDEDEDDDDDSDEEEIGNGGGRVNQNRGGGKVMMTRGKRKPLTASEIHRVLFNSIMEEANTKVVEEPLNKPHEKQDTTRSVSSDSSDTDSNEEMDTKNTLQEELDSMYRMMDFHLAGDHDNADVAAACLEAEDARNQEQLCRGGEHYLILDEEIGILCKLCGHVREEIRHVLPPFNENPWGFSYRNRYSAYDYHDPKNLPCFEDPNIDSKHSKEDAEFDPTGTVWEIIPDIRKTLFPHQRAAFEFIWRNVSGGTELKELMSEKASEGGGCLISHDPGTGKTRLAIAFLETHMKFYKNSRPIILAPASILLTWKKEFEKWKVGIPFLNMNDNELSEHELSIAGSLFGKNCEKNLTNMARRWIKLLCWVKHESALAISYTLFTQLAGGEDVKKGGRKKKSGSRTMSGSRLLDQEEKCREWLLQMPGLLILDEGHMPRNEKSQMFDVLSRVKTKKRVLLSGTPFQNNFRELYNLLCLVRKEFVAEENPFKSNGSNQYDEADEGKIREFKEKVKPFCHRYDNYIISATVPGLVDHVLYLQPSDLQNRLLKIEEEEKSKKSYLQSNVNMTLISVHPLLLSYKNTSPDIEEELKSGRLSIDDSAKMRFLIRLIELSSILEEKVLVFSQYLHPLNFVKALLMSEKYFGWRDGVEIQVMSGNQEMETRQRTMEKFNRSRSEAKVMLASTKACSEGIELIGASRVVLLDVTWNPSVERQAISRAYRMGQRKVVHVYHLIMTDDDNNRHFSQTQKNNFSKYMFPSNNNNTTDVSGSSKPLDCEDIILERLLEENIIKKATCKKINPSN